MKCADVRQISAQLIIKVDFAADAKGLDVSIACESKLPKRPIIKERFFMSEKNTLTLQDPAKDSLFEGADLGRRRAMPQ